MRKVALYCRVSTDEQAKNKEGSITSQVQRLQMKVNEKNSYENGQWGKVVGIYKDEAYSGKNTDRPEFQRMLTDVKTQRVNTILITELSRLSRSVTDFLSFIEELEDHGCDFICPQYDFDTTSPAGKVFMTIIMALAQFERELTAERIRNNFHARALRGLSNGGVPFLGYDRDPTQSGQLLVNTHEGVIVKKIFDLYLEGKSLSESAKYLNEENIKNKSWISKDGKACGGQPFRATSVLRTLTNYAYIGKREVNKRNKKLVSESLKTEEQYTLVDSSWKAIIDPETFQKAQTKLNINKKVKKPMNFDFCYSGIMVCDECGAPLSGKTGTGRNRIYFYYGHNRKTSCKVQRYDAEALEKVLRRQLFTLINNEAMGKQFIQALSEQVQGSSKISEALLKKTQEDIGKRHSENERLINLMADHAEAQGLDALLGRIKKNEAEILELKAQLSKLEEQRIIEAAQPTIDPQFILSGIKKFREDGFRKAKVSKKRAIVQDVIKTIHVHPDNVIRIDFWTSESQSSVAVKDAFQSGVVLPFQPLGRPLEASFRENASREDRFSDIKRAANLGVYILPQGRMTPKSSLGGSFGPSLAHGSSSVVTGGGGGN